MAKKQRTKPKKMDVPLWPNKIRQWRESRDWTLEYLAPLANMSVSNLSLLERGRIKYTPKTLGNLAKVFGCRPDDLVDSEPGDLVAAISSAARRLSGQQQASLIQFIETMVPTAGNGRSET